MPPGELARLYDAHAAALFAYLLNLTRDEAGTRDALQEIFRRLAARPDALRGVRDERGWLLRLAHNLAVDALRRRDARTRAHEALAAAVAGLHRRRPRPAGRAAALGRTGRAGPGPAARACRRGGKDPPARPAGAGRRT